MSTNFKQGSVFYVEDRDRYRIFCKCGQKIDLVNISCSNCGQIHKSTKKLLGSRYEIIISAIPNHMYMVVPTQKMDGERFAKYDFNSDPFRLALHTGPSGLPLLSYAVLNQLYCTDKKILERADWKGNLNSTYTKNLIKSVIAIMGSN